jgi:hypothetical protein
MAVNVQLQPLFKFIISGSEQKLQQVQMHCLQNTGLAAPALEWTPWKVFKKQNSGL